MLRYALAVALAAVATGAVALVGGTLRAYTAFISVGAVLLAGLRGGAGPGFVALALCAAAYAMQMGEPPSAAWLEEPDPVHRLAFFVGFAALGVWAASAAREGYRHTQARRRKAEARADAQRIAAELGVRALAEGDLDALLCETVAAVRRALHCDASSLLELQPDGESVRVRNGAGWARDAVGQVLARPEAPLAFRALAAREPLAVDDLASEPDIASSHLLQAGAASVLVAPIVAAGPGGRSFGVLTAQSRVRRTFGADEASFLQAAANVIGTAVVRARSEERVRHTLEVERFLAEASRQLALSIDWHETLARVAKLAVPFMGDWSLVVVVDAEGRPRSVAAEVSDPARAAAVRELLERYPIDLDARHGVGHILRSGTAELMPEVPTGAFVEGDRGTGTPVRQEILERLGLRSYLGAPLAVGERILGAIAFGVADGPRRYGAEDLAVAQALAQRCASALENARLYRAAQEATRVREEVLAVVSHDLKTPLGALLMGAQVVVRLAPAGAAGDELRKAAATVRRTSERMGRLIHDLVDVASMEAGRLSLAPAQHDAAAVAREATEALQALASDRNVAVALEVHAPVPLYCDRDRVLQALTNLLANALQVTPAGGSVRLAVRRDAAGAVFTVSDRGPGIPAEDLPHLFERWYRGRHPRYPGSGLGLAIARAIAEAHHGRIWVESEEGQGSAFSFAIPCPSSRDASAP